MISEGSSTLPNIMVALVRMPIEWASCMTLSQRAESILRGLRRLRTRSVSISAPPPGMESSPASLNTQRASRIVISEQSAI